MSAARGYAEVIAACDEFTAWYRDNPEPGIPLVVPPLIKQAAALLAGVAAALPDCPVCGGTRRVADNAASMAPDLPAHPCPDCTDGKVSVEQLAATWQAVHDEALDIHHGSTIARIIDHLRSVRPPSPKEGT